jgi:tetratricopeptide (TPR) repeat protein
MTATRRFRLRVFVCLAILGIPTGLQAQFGLLSSSGQAAQARSQEELDSYLEIVSATDDRVIVDRVKAFVSEFPKSELLGAAYQYQLQAFERLNDFDGMLAAGEKALVSDPDSLNTLLALAPAMATRAAGRPDRIQLLAQAESYAHRVLTEIDKIRIPHELSIEQWDARKHQMQSEAHGVLGVVALQGGQSQQAISELEMSVSLAPKPEGVQFLRLGLALVSAGKKKDAGQKLRRAVELGPEPVRKAALAQMKKLN